MPGSHPTAAASATTTTQVAVPATPTATSYSGSISERTMSQELPRPKRAAAQRANVYLYQETFDWNEERALKRAIDASLQAIDSDATGQLDEDDDHSRQPPSSAGADCLEAMANNHNNNQRNGSRSGRASAVTAANLNPNNNNNSNNPNSRRKKPNASTANNPTASNRSNSFKTNKPIVHSSRLKAGRNGATRARPVKPLPTASKATANCRASTSLSSVSQKNGPARPKKTLNSASVNYKQSNCSTVAVNVASSRSGATVNGQLSLDESDSSPSESSCATSSSTSSFSKDKENRFSVQTSGSQKITMARPTKSYRRPKAAAKSPLTVVTSPEVPIKRRSAKSRSSKSSAAAAKPTVQSKSSLVPIAEQSSEPIQTMVMEVTLHENRVPESDLVDSGPSSSSYGYGTSHDPMESGSDSSPDYHHHPELEGHYKLDEFGDIDLTHCDPIQEMLLTKNAGKFFALYDNYIIVGIDGYNAFWERVRKLYAEDDPQDDSADTPHSPVNHSQPGPNSPHQSQMDDSFSSGDRLFGSVDSDLDTTDLSELI